MKVRSLTEPQRFQKNRVTNSASTNKQTRAEYPGKAALGREAGVRKSNISNKKPIHYHLLLPSREPSLRPWELSAGQTGMEPELDYNMVNKRLPDANEIGTTYHFKT